MKTFIKIINYAILFLVLAIVVFVYLSFPKHASFEKCSEILNTNKISFNTIGNEFFNQNKIQSFVRKDIRRLPFGKILSWFEEYDITYTIGIPEYYFEIKIKDDCFNCEKLFWNKNYNEIYHRKIDLENFLINNNIPKTFFDNILSFSIEFNVFSLSKFWNNRFVLIKLEIDEGLLYVPNYESNLHDLEYGYEIKKIDDKWYYLKEK